MFRIEKKNIFVLIIRCTQNILLCLILISLEVSICNLNFCTYSIHIFSVSYALSLLCQITLGILCIATEESFDKY